jgi:hypothetical protein
MDLTCGFSALVEFFGISFDTAFGFELSFNLAFPSSALPMELVMEMDTATQKRRDKFCFIFKTLLQMGPVAGHGTAQRTIRSRIGLMVLKRQTSCRWHPRAEKLAPPAS